MRNPIWMLVTCALCLSGAVAGAVQPPDAAGAGHQATAPQPTLASTTLRMRGTIDDYDAKTRMLSISTSTGIVRLPLAASVRIRQGGRSIEARDLAHLTGHRAAVRYSDAPGQRVAQSVNVFESGEGQQR